MSCKLFPSMISENKTPKIAWQFIYCDRDGLRWLWTKEDDIYEIELRLMMMMTDDMSDDEC